MFIYARLSWQVYQTDSTCNIFVVRISFNNNALLLSVSLIKIYIFYPNHSNGGGKPQQFLLISFLLQCMRAMISNVFIKI